jgi:hypothetical protein
MQDTLNAFQKFNCIFWTYSFAFDKVNNSSIVFISTFIYSLLVFASVCGLIVIMAPMAHCRVAIGKAFFCQAKLSTGQWICRTAR